MKTHNFHATRAVDVFRGRTGSPIAGVASIYGSAISGAPTDGNVLVWDAATGTWLVESVGSAPLNTISPAQLVANTDNWNPTGLSTADVIRASTDASRNLTGIVAPAISRKIVLENVGAQPLVLKHDATSTTANRFYCPSDTDYTVAKDSAVLLVYDVTSSRWRVVDEAVAAVPAFATPSIAYGTPAGGAASTVIRSDATIAKPTAADVDFSADVTTNNVTTGHHGLVPKADGNAAHYLDGSGAYSTPAGAGTSVTRTAYRDVSCASGATTTIGNDSTIARIGCALIFPMDGNDGACVVQYYRDGSFNQVFGFGNASTGQFEFRGGTFTAGANGFSIFLASNSAGAALQLKNNNGFGRTMRIWEWGTTANLA